MSIPRGVLLGVPMHAIHHDEAFYSSASRFDPFRFSRPREAHKAKIKSAKTQDAIPIVQDSSIIGVASSPDCFDTETNNSSETIKPTPTVKPQSTVDGDGAFLGFGYGRHMCPGRFFASHEMKLMLAHIVQHYDIEFMPKRPASQTIMEVKLPAESAEIRVRRRIKV